MKKIGIFKKTISLILTVLVLLTLSIPIMAKSPIIFNEKIQVKNNIVCMEIEITPESDICGLSLEIKYDENQVKVNKTTIGEMLESCIAKSNDTILGKVLFTCISMTPMKDSGSIILIEFESLSSDNKNIDIDCVISECIDKDCAEITYTYSKKDILNPKYSGAVQTPDINISSTVNSSEKNQEVERESTNEEENLSQLSSSSSQTSSEKESAVNTSSEKVTNESGVATSSNDGTDNSGNNVSELSNAEDSEAVENISSDSGKQINQNKNKDVIWLIILGCVGIVGLMVVYYKFITPKILKRRSRNEKN